jgi:nucleotide-binding universal stress UspA family protein
MSALREREHPGQGVVLVAFDGTAAAERALTHAAALVGSGGHVTVVNVIPTQSVSARLQTVSDKARDSQRSLLNRARKLLDRRGVKATLVGAVGDPIVEILAAANEAGAGTLVIGRGRRGHGLHMHVGERIVRRATNCDVLVVH